MATTPGTTTPNPPRTRTQRAAVPTKQYGANEDTRRILAPNFVDLRSSFKTGINDADDNNDLLYQGRAYFSGGARDTKNICTFSYNNGSKNELITLYLSPNNVTWDYRLKTNVIDTYGGQVVQILGVAIENLTIEGFFGSEGMWGYNFKEVDSNQRSATYGKYQSRFVQGDRRDWNEDYGDLGNGMVQFSEWFKRYFYHTTQAGNFKKQNMTFRYPHMGWEWKIRPLNFPRVRFSNDELMPQWQIECDFIEDLQSHFTQNVLETAKIALSRLKDGVGFEEFIQWSEPTYTSVENRKAAAEEIATKYSDMLGNGFSESEIETLIARGYTYPVTDMTPYVDSSRYQTTPGSATLRPDETLQNVNEG